MAKPSDTLPANENGHVWEYVPYTSGAPFGSYRCKLCLTSYDMGHGRQMQCDEGEQFRKSVKKSMT